LKKEEKTKDSILRLGI